MPIIMYLVSGGTHPAPRPDSRIPTLSSLSHKIPDSQRIRSGHPNSWVAHVGNEAREGQAPSRPVAGPGLSAGLLASHPGLWPLPAIPQAMQSSTDKSPGSDVIHRLQLNACPRPEIGLRFLPFIRGDTISDGGHSQCQSTKI